MMDFWSYDKKIFEKSVNYVYYATKSSYTISIVYAWEWGRGG